MAILELPKEQSALGYDIARALEFEGIIKNISSLHDKKTHVIFAELTEFGFEEYNDSPTFGNV